MRSTLVPAPWRVYHYIQRLQNFPKNKTTPSIRQTQAKAQDEDAFLCTSHRKLGVWVTASSFHFNNARVWKVDWCHAFQGSRRHVNTLTAAHLWGFWFRGPGGPENSFSSEFPGSSDTAGPGPRSEKRQPGSAVPVRQCVFQTLWWQGPLGDVREKTGFISMPDSPNQNLCGESWDAVRSDLGKHYCCCANPATHPWDSRIHSLTALNCSLLIRCMLWP